VLCKRCGRPSAGELCIFCRIEEKKAKLPEWHTVLQDGEWQVMRHLYFTDWFRLLRNGEIFAEVQVNADFPDENTMQETVTIRRQNRTTVLRRTNPAAPAALNPAELLRLVQQ
jgi:hypothetical protein